MESSPLRGLRRKSYLECLRWYKAPEILFGSRSYGSEVDVWSFACIFGEMLNGAPLFPGNNDLHQVSKIAKYLGSPTEKNWPEIVNLPDYGKIQFDEFEPVPLSEIFADSSEEEVEFLQSVLSYQDRPSCKDLLGSKYLKQYPPPLERLIIEERRLDFKPRKYEEIFGIE